MHQQQVLPSHLMMKLIVPDSIQKRERENWIEYIQTHHAFHEVTSIITHLETWPHHFASLRFEIHAFQALWTNAFEMMLRVEMTYGATSRVDWKWEEEEERAKENALNMILMISGDFDQYFAVSWNKSESSKIDFRTAHVTSVRYFLQNQFFLHSFAKERKICSFQS